ncbi:MAG: hypothetical protein R3E66_05950 [bacterium]
MIRRIAALALLVVVGCDDKPSDGLPPTVVIAAGETNSAPTEDLPAKRHLEWPGDFALWNGTNIEDGRVLPPCPASWFDKRLDDTYAVWKCSNYPDVSFGKGELVVHTHHNRIVMVTTTVACADEAACVAQRQKLIEINTSRNVAVPAKLGKLFDNIWNLNTYHVALSAGHLGFSVMYFADVAVLQAMNDLRERQANPPRIGRDYSLGDIRYRLKSVTHENDVGRGKSRWSSKNDSVFVVVDYEVENRSRTIVQEDPAEFSLVTRSKVYAPDVKAEDYHRRADRTGLLVTPLEYKSRRPRTHVFEVKRDDIARSALLVIARDDDKLVYQLE